MFFGAGSRVEAFFLLISFIFFIRVRDLSSMITTMGARKKPSATDDNDWADKDGDARKSGGVKIIFCQRISGTSTDA